MNHKDLIYPCEGKAITIPEEPPEVDLIDLIKRVEALEKCIDTSDLSSLIKSFFDHESLESCYVEQMIQLFSDYQKVNFMNFGWGTKQLGPIVIYYVMGCTRSGLFKFDLEFVGCRILNSSEAFINKVAIAKLENLKELGQKKEDNKVKLSEKKQEETLQEEQPKVKKRSWWRRKTDAL